VRAELEAGARLPPLVRPLLGLFQGQPGARGWRRRLTVDSLAPRAGAEVIEAALDSVREATLRRALEPAI
jgi:tRNA-dihydrouridine synthase A